MHARMMHTYVHTTIQFSSLPLARIVITCAALVLRKDEKQMYSLCLCKEEQEAVKLVTRAIKISPLPDLCTIEIDLYR